MVAETDVLGGNKCSYDGRYSVAIQLQMSCGILRKKLLILNVRAVLDKESADNVTIVAINLGCKVASRVLQLRERGHTAEDSEGSLCQHNKYQGNGGHTYHPHRFDYSVLVVKKSLEVHLFYLMQLQTDKGMNYFSFDKIYVT